MHEAVYATVLLVRDGIARAAWPLNGEGRPDIGVVDELARQHQRARRLGYELALLNPCADLTRLLELAGLTELFGSGAEYVD